MQNPFDISNKHVLLFGASGGIGREIAVVLSQMGAILGLSGRNAARLEETLSLLSGTNHYILPADITTLDDTAPIFDSAIVKYGKLDGMIYAAGVIPIIPLQATSIIKSNEIFRINVVSFIDAVLNYTKRKYSNGGTIIGISSIAAVHPEKGQVQYAASKAAMNAAVSVMAQELCSKGIRVNAILPGIVKPEQDCENTHDMFDLTKQPLGMVEPKDVGNMCAYLMSDASKSISGRLFYIDGLRM